jgi:hypothetical protein
MMAGAAAAVILAWLLGTMAVGAAWPQRPGGGAGRLAILSLGLGIGLGLSSAIFFAATLVSPHPARISAALELLAAAVFAGQWRRRNRLGREAAEPIPPPWSWGEVVLGSLFAQAVVVALVVAARAGGREPFGSWDGWAIWNLHARFLYWAGPAWPRLLGAPALAWSHPDYPLLLPASVARIWAFAGSDSALLSAVISTLFGVATVGLLVAMLIPLRGRLWAFAGGLVLLGTPFFVTFSSNEHADIPLGFFMLATAAALALSPRWPDSRGLAAIAGLAAGLAAWTKNEGLLCALVAALLWVYAPGQRRSWRSRRGFLTGLAVGLLPVAYFKWAIAPPNDLVSSHPAEHLARLGDWARHQQILTAFWQDTAQFGQWRIVPFFALALPLVAPFWRRLNRAECAVALLIALILAGYYGVYLLTPWDLGWHLEYSLVRLLLQLWPAAILLWGLAASDRNSTPPESAPKARASGRQMAAIGILNGIVAMGVLAALGRQLADNEFAAARVGGATVSVVAGDGWFERETGGGQTWRWSAGAATLWLRVNGAPSPIALKFGIRGLGARSVTARIGPRIIWHGQVGSDLTEVEIGPIAVPAGFTAIALVSDEPGVRESANPDARELTYAVYDLRLK